MNDQIKVSIKNTTNSPLLIALPELRFRRTWAPGASLKVDKEILDEGIYDAGFRRLLEQGMLYVEDAEVREGLVAESLIPQEIKLLNRGQMLKLLKADTVKVFEETINEISKDQVSQIVDFAINEKIIDVAKSEILKAKTGLDVIKAIQLKIQNEE